MWPEDGAADASLPLAGVRVLDLSKVLAGPLCGAILGDLGADVLKVEAPAGDPARALAPPRHGDDATFFLGVNRNRRLVRVDLNEVEGLELVGALAAEAQVVVENFLPRQAERLGIDALREANPQLVWVSIRPSANGSVGDGAPAFDLLAQAASGIFSVNGSEASGGLKAGAPVADVTTGLYAAIAALAGLASGGGCHVTVPLLESTVSLLVNHVAAYLATGHQPRLLGNDHPSIVPYGQFEAADGPLIVAAGTDVQFRALAELLGEAWAADPRFATNAARVEHRDLLGPLLSARLAEQDRGHWVEALAAAGVPASPVLGLAEAVEAANGPAGDLVVEAGHPAGPYRSMLNPLRWNGRRLPLRRPAPSTPNLDLRRGEGS